MGVLKKCGNFLATSSTALINDVPSSLCQHRHKSTNFLFSPKEILIFLWSVVFCVNLNIRFPKP